MNDGTEQQGEELALGYEQAIVELEAIVTDLQNDEVGVDELAERVARGARLVELCRDRLRRAELAVDDVVDALRAATEQDVASEQEPRSPEQDAASEQAPKPPEQEAASEEDPRAGQHPAAEREPGPDDLLF